MQLVAYGAQDVYLTGDPEITFFKVVYRRHTNFSVESIQQTINGTVALGSDITVTISRNGDLVNNLLVEATCTAGAGASPNRLGFALLKEVEIEIGGQRIDKQYSNWMNVWTELTLSGEKKRCLSEMMDVDTAGASQVFYVPLQFWFCRDNGLALPLIALQYHEVKLKISFETSANLCDPSLTGISNFSAKVWADYVYLDTDERRKFAQKPHEYLIEQVQRSVEAISGNPESAKFRLNFNHPVKELVWVTPPSFIDRAGNGFSGAIQADQSWGQYATNVDTARLVLNGHERFEKRSGTYFNYVQPFQHHTGCPSGGVYVYSFALNPEKHQPSGTCNFSRIDNATLELDLKAPTNIDDVSTMEIYAHNYNVLRIMSGMGGLAYSN
jgi:hypothetical protein